MGDLSEMFGLPVQETPLRDQFLRWQCRVRQEAMRMREGQPDDGVVPSLTLEGQTELMGHIVTVLNKSPSHSKTPELRHMYQRTVDPKARRDKAIELFSETYFQKAREFSDCLTATFPPKSAGAAAIQESGRCRLTFEAFAQRYDLACDVITMSPRDPLFQATYWHNALFNPNMHPEMIVLGFKPDWAQSSSGST